MHIKQVTITREQNKMVRAQLDSHTAALKNWIISAFDAGDMERAKRLSAELKQYQEMFHIFVPDDMWER
jgi:hypothetical protein